MTSSLMTDKFDFEDASSVYGHLDNLTSVLGDIDKEEDKDMDKDEGHR